MIYTLFMWFGISVLACRLIISAAGFIRRNSKHLLGLLFLAAIFSAGFAMGMSAYNIAMAVAIFAFIRGLILLAIEATTGKGAH